MHSKIFQVSTEPIEKDARLSPIELYDNCGDFADYIGDEYHGDERLAKIQFLAKEFPDIFNIDGEVLIYKGLGNFVNDWIGSIREAAQNLTEENIFNDGNLYRVRHIVEDTHYRIFTRFYINNWNCCPDPFGEFIGWLSRLDVGTRIYVGSVIDYHF